MFIDSSGLRFLMELYFLVHYIGILINVTLLACSSVATTHRLLSTCTINCRRSFPLNAADNYPFWKPSVTTN